MTDERLQARVTKLEDENARQRNALESIKRRFGTGVCKLCQSCSIDKQVALQEIAAALDKPTSKPCLSCEGTGTDDTPTFDRDACAACGGSGLDEPQEADHAD